MVEIDTPAADPVALRIAMVERLRDWDVIGSEPVEAAMRAVPRHVFVPDAGLDQAYAFNPVITHRDAAGVAISSASAPGVVAGMLEQLAVRPGHHVLEIGAGTGYNAALLAYLVGEAGRVSTVEYKKDVAADARAALRKAGYPNVTVVCGDGWFGYAENAPYDRITVTAGAWDVAPAWWDQLSEGGRLLVPLRMRGLTRTVALEREGDILVSRSVEECGFIPMRGVGEVAEQNVRIGPDGDIVLRVDDGRQVDADALVGALDHAPVVVWTGVHVPFGMFDRLDFWLAGLDGYCRVLPWRTAVEEERLVAAAYSWGSMGFFDSGTVAYLTMRPHDEADDSSVPSSELGVCAYGPDGQAMASRVANRIQEWEQDDGQRTDIRIEVHPITAPRPADARLVVDKKHTRVVVRTARSSQQ